MAENAWMKGRKASPGRSPLQPCGKQEGGQIDSGEDFHRVLLRMPRSMMSKWGEVVPSTKLSATPPWPTSTGQHEVSL
jgi:hypothetical protein